MMLWEGDWGDDANMGIDAPVVEEKKAQEGEDVEI
jgi:hypothetical protein